MELKLGSKSRTSPPFEHDACTPSTKLVDELFKLVSPRSHTTSLLGFPNKEQQVSQLVVYSGIE